MTLREVDLPEKPKVWLGEDGIVYNDLSGFRHLTISLAQYLYRERRRLSGKRKTPVLVLAADLLTIDFEVQVFASRPNMAYWTSAMAIVGDSFMLRHFVSMFVSYHDPAFPVELFCAHDEAQFWLQGLSGECCPLN